ncbi:MAG: response regulator [Candidatus Tectomicrobia bacterium]|uniref:histidine kinase n=1 Tax=Tectimicrobiota bacterium TaxID=2528274 RepID=A0A937VZ75_UNCTE|nr:response regulator [Candidatus Tectomicrobia bacterium]
MYTATLPTALVINDDPSQLHLMSALLEKDGVRVLSCQSAEEALGILDERSTVDVIVTDLHMPGIDGWRFCRLLRSPQYPMLNTVPVLVVSATFSGTDTEEVTADLGANAFLAVPYASETLRDSVRTLLAGRTPSAAMRVVVVENNPVQSTILRQAFEAHGYTVSIAATGREGRRLLYEQVPAIAVIDYHLPDMTGEDLLQEFVRPGSPMVAIILTTDPAPTLALRCLRLGADHFIHKPFEPAYLLDLCAKARRSRALLRVEGLLEERTQKLRESEAKFRQLFDSIPETVLVYDAQGRILYVNDVGADWLGWSATTLTGHHLRDVLVSADVSHMLAPGSSVSSGSHRKMTYMTRTRQELEAEVNISPLEFESQTAWLAVARDITERTRLEGQLHQAQKMQAMGTLAGGIAHDFNNILAAIMGYSELALYEAPHGGRMRHHLEEVLAAGKRARDLVQQILAFSRKRPPERQPVSLHLLLNETLRMLRASLPSTITIEADFPALASTVQADPTQLQQVLMNLCANAEHAMRDTGGILTLRLEAVEVSADFADDHASLKPGPHVCLTIQDTGSGMTPEVQARIFEPFFTTKAVGEGVGMGLAVVDGIIASHGGAITVASGLGQGATFRLYLPRTDHPLPTPEAPADPRFSRGSGRILLVDDEPTLAYMTAEMLKRLGYGVTVHTSSTDTLATFRAAPWQFDLVMTDQTMPGLTGERLARELRQLRPDIPIVLCTGFSHTMNAAKAQGLGLDAFLSKPVELRELSAVLRQVLAQRRES